MKKLILCITILLSYTINAQLIDEPSIDPGNNNLPNTTNTITVNTTSGIVKVRIKCEECSGFDCVSYGKGSDNKLYKIEKWSTIDLETKKLVKYTKVTVVTSYPVGC